MTCTTSFELITFGIAFCIKRKPLRAREKLRYNRSEVILMVIIEALHALSTYIVLFKTKKTIENFRTFTKRHAIYEEYIHHKHLRRLYTKFQ